MTDTAVRVITGLAESLAADRTDGALLDRFAQRRDREAFAPLVRRHGPMVLGVCRRILRNPADADDAFQAAILVLARKAPSLVRRDGLAGFLHAVAFNAARKLRQSNQRRATRETPLDGVAEPSRPEPDAERDELFSLLDEEVSRLPERYRVPIVLCDLEGATRKEAAARLGWPEGTVAGRLARARALLADRLAARGVVPVAGVVAAVLAEPATASPGLVAATVRTVTDSAASPHVVKLCEGVISAMFAKKLRTAALLFAALTLTGVGVWQFATAQPGPKPPTEPLPGPAAANPAPAADGRGLTILPLKKLDPEAAAKVIADGYKGKGVTVAAVPTERLLLLYADQKTATEIQELLKKLGEDNPHAPQVIRLTGLNALDAARELVEVFNGPAVMGRAVAGERQQRITVVPLANANALLVYASPVDMVTVRTLLKKYIVGDFTPESAKPAPELKRYTVRFENVKWDDVLKWFAEQSGLTPIYTAKPTGTLTLLPPKERVFTIGEVLDLLNEALLQQKFLIIRRGVSFTLHPTNEKIDISQIPRIELSELPRRGKTELVQVLIPLKNIDAKETAPEVEKMLTPFGSVSTLARINTLVVLDTAGNISRIHQTLPQVEEDACDILTHKYLYRKATEEAEKLKTLLADAKGGQSFEITVDERNNAVTITGKPEKIALAKRIIEDNDKPRLVGPPPPISFDVELRKYSVPPGTAEELGKMIQKLYPTLRVLALPTTNEMMVLATAAEHREVEKVLGLIPGADGKKEPEKK